MQRESRYATGLLGSKVPSKMHVSGPNTELEYTVFLSVTSP